MLKKNKADMRLMDDNQDAQAAANLPVFGQKLESLQAQAANEALEDLTVATMTTQAPAVTNRRWSTDKGLLEAVHHGMPAPLQERVQTRAYY
eukprot:85524-Amphidinium_carterae.1